MDMVTEPGADGRRSEDGRRSAVGCVVDADTGDHVTQII